MARKEFLGQLENIDKLYPKISEYAYYILRGDQFSFGIIPTKGNGKTVNTKLVGRIFVNCYDEIINELKSSNMQKSASDAAKSLNLNCNTDIRGTLMSDDITDEIWEAFGGMNKHSPNKLAAYIIEQYAGKVYPERERLFFSKEYAIIASAAENDELVRFKANSKNERTILPIGIMTDEWSTYNYIVGISVISGELSVNRLSRVSDVRPVKNKEAFDNIGEMRKKAEETINQRGIMFVSSNIPEEGIKIQMTEHGERMFNTMVFMRPVPTMVEKISQNNFCREYTFDCTEQQARNYFFKFGKEVRVVSPDGLRDKFISDFKAALKGYDISEDDIGGLYSHPLDIKESVNNKK